MAVSHRHRPAAGNLKAGPQHTLGAAGHKVRRPLHVVATALLAALSLAVAVALALPAAELAAQHTIGDVPFVKQQPRWCGPAALESVLRHYGVAVTQSEIAREIALPDGRVLNLDLKLYARRKGLRAESLRGDPDRLRQWISRDVPVICQVRLDTLGARENHFVVVYGYDGRKLCFVVHTGERAAQEIPYVDFTGAWKEADYWMLVIRPRPRERPQPSQSPPQVGPNPSAPPAEAGTADSGQAQKHD